MTFLQRVVDLCEDDGGLLIGVDLRKDRRVLERAYNDNAGVTAQFNLNLLARANRELGANFDLRQCGITRFTIRTKAGSRSI